MKSRLKAFTILEMLMSVAIMSIIVSLLYFVYTSFSKQIFLYKKEITSVEEVYGFYTQLRKDTYLCSRMIKKNNQLVLSFYDGRSVVYVIDKQALKRRQGSQELSVKATNFSFVPQFKNLSQGQLISQFEFEAQLLDRKTTFSVSKNYASDVLLELYGN